MLLRPRAAAHGVAGDPGADGDREPVREAAGSRTRTARNVSRRCSPTPSTSTASRRWRRPTRPPTATRRRSGTRSPSRSCRWSSCAGGSPTTSASTSATTVRPSWIPPDPCIAPRCPAGIASGRETSNRSLWSPCRRCSGRCWQRSPRRRERRPTTRGPNPIVRREPAPQGTDRWDIPWPGYKITDDRHLNIKGYATAVSVLQGGSHRPARHHEAARAVHRRRVPARLLPGSRRTAHRSASGRSRGRLSRRASRCRELRHGDVPVAHVRDARGAVRRGRRASTWPSLTTASHFQNEIPFTVRDTRPADILYVSPVNTYQAYNNFPYDPPVGTRVELGRVPADGPEPVRLQQPRRRRATPTGSRRSRSRSTGRTAPSTGTRGTEASPTSSRSRSRSWSSAATTSRTPPTWTWTRNRTRCCTTPSCSSPDTPSTGRSGCTTARTPRATPA